MRHPPNGNGAPGHHTGNAADTLICTPAKKLDRLNCSSDTRQVHVAEGELFAPYGRRRQWSLIVRRCPGCAHMHQHRTVAPTRDVYARTGSCGVDYLIRPVRVWLAGAA